MCINYGEGVRGVGGWVVKGGIGHAHGKHTLASGPIPDIFIIPRFRLIPTGDEDRTKREADQSLSFIMRGTVQASLTLHQPPIMSSIALPYRPSIYQAVSIMLC